MSLLTGLAQHLHDRGLGTYRSTGAYLAGEWAVVFETVPQAPDRVIVLSVYAGPESDSRLGWDQPSVQVRTRGPADDPLSSLDKAQAIYDHLHGLGPVTLPDGTWLQLAVGSQAGPVPLGVDSNRRSEHTVNVRCEVRRVTEHRV